MVLRPFIVLYKGAIFVLVPIFQLLFSIKRKITAITRPAKNRLMLSIANRYTIHAVIIAVVLVIGVLNLRTGVVRAESFGRDSIMYGLVVQDKAEIVQEFAGDYSSIQLSEINYREQTGISQRALESGAVLAESDATSGSIFDGVLALSDAEYQSSSERSQTETYVVQSGDSLSAISDRFDLSINTLLWANNLSVNSVLRPGDSLTILPVDGVKHTVKSGDTIAQISKNYDADQQTILAYNGMGGSDILSIGDELIIPGGEFKAATRSTSTAISQLFTQPSPTAANVAVGSGYMIWPSDLSVITQYFSWKHNGLDIDCHYDNYNYASDDGYVTKSGWYGGYGYLVEIDHGNGIVTRYGHHAALYVSPGQYVNAGDALGLCGTTGTSTGTHLHFEVIVNGVRKNPLEYIR